MAFTVAIDVRPTLVTNVRLIRQICPLCTHPRVQLCKRVVSWLIPALALVCHDAVVCLKKELGLCLVTCV